MLNKEYYTTSEAADELGVGYAKICYLIQTGRLNAKRLDRGRGSGMTNIISHEELQRAKTENFGIHLSKIKVYCATCDRWVSRTGKHETSVLHTRGEEFQKLLADASLNMTEISEKLGITRERVRQLAQKFGQTGKTRRASYVKQRREKLTKFLPQHSFIERAQKRGINLESIIQERRDGSFVMLRTKVRANGFVCHLRHCKPTTHNPNIVHNNFSPKFKLDGCDFIIMTVDNVDLTFIIPKNEVPDSGCSLTIEPKIDITLRSRLARYANAWHYLDDANGST